MHIKSMWSQSFDGTFIKNMKRKKKSYFCIVISSINCLRMSRNMNPIPPIRSLSCLISSKPDQEHVLHGSARLRWIWRGRILCGAAGPGENVSLQIWGKGGRSQLGPPKLARKTARSLHQEEEIIYLRWWAEELLVFFEGPCDRPNVRNDFLLFTKS